MTSNRGFKQGNLVDIDVTGTTAGVADGADVADDAHLLMLPMLLSYDFKQGNLLDLAAVAAIV